MKQLADNLVAIINILNDGEFHSGQALGDQLNITRSGVWKFIGQLQKYGIEIEARKPLGYRLTRPIILLDKNQILPSLTSAQRQQVTLLTFGSVDSTNTYLMQQGKTPLGEYLCCTAEMQTQGKGRLNRQWISPFGHNIYCSMRRSFASDFSALTGLSFVFSLAMIHCLEHFGVTDLKIKWPNDIYHQQKKLAGCLVELTSESHGCCDMVAGMGINITMDQQSSQKIDQPWTCVESILHRTVDRNEVIGELLKQSIQAIDLFTESGLPAILQQWRGYDYLQGSPISVKNFNHILSGTAAGVDEQGHLLLNTADGVVTISAGDASIIK